jgi:hypothetical protein
MIILTSECNDTGTIPNANRLLFSPVRAELQGHKCILEGPNPGMLIADKGFYTACHGGGNRVCLAPYVSSALIYDKAYRYIFKLNAGD